MLVFSFPLTGEREEFLERGGGIGRREKRRGCDGNGDKQQGEFTAVHDVPPDRTARSQMNNPTGLYALTQRGEETIAPCERRERRQAVGARSSAGRRWRLQ